MSKYSDKKINDICEALSLLGPNKAPNAFEFSTEKLIKHCLTQGACGIDVGANYGAHTHTMIHSVGKSGQVIAFEAAPDVAGQIKSWEAAHPNLSVINCAVCDDVGLIEFNVSSNRGYGSIIERRASTGGIEIKVTIQASTLDKFANIIKCPVRFIKLDVEGVEHRCLQGGGELIARYNPVISTEFDWNEIEKDMGSRENFMNFIDRLGVSGYEFLDMTGRPIEIGGSDFCGFLIPKASEDKDFIKSVILDAVESFIDQGGNWSVYDKFN